MTWWRSMPTLIAPMTARAQTGDGHEPSPEDALDFILYEHLRHRVMCNDLDALAEAEIFRRERGDAAGRVYPR
ncbi:MAG: hypothetical protein IPL62_09305 [Caulobacteraceae bacterium]|nr:hypothetical protein [Caulobacteraceae bacterium]